MSQHKRFLYLSHSRATMTGESAQMRGLARAFVARIHKRLMLMKTQRNNRSLALQIRQHDRLKEYFLCTSGQYKNSLELADKNAVKVGLTRLINSYFVLMCGLSVWLGFRMRERERERERAVLFCLFVFVYTDCLSGNFLLCLFVCFLALRPKSTAMAMAGRSVHSWADLNKRLTSNSCTYSRL